jgi:hypothetical protein
MTMPKRDSSMMLTAVRRLWGHWASGPKTVRLQSVARMSAPSSPPPERESSGRDAVVCSWNIGHSFLSEGWSVAR